MNTETAQILCDLNTAFYREQSASFAETRQSPWPGWKWCVELWQVADMGEAAVSGGGVDTGTVDSADVAVEKRAASGGAQAGVTGSAGTSALPPATVFDLACGNLRLESFLRDAFPQVDTTCYAVDNCDSMVPAMLQVHYQSLDIVQALINGTLTRETFAAPMCDLSVSFGFMHHVPSERYRQQVLRALVEQTCPGGMVAVSFWQFLNSEKLAAKAQVTHAQALTDLVPHGLDAAQLEDGDYLLGWKDVPGAYRYCHNFTEDEINRLVESVASQAKVVSRFMSDGRTNNLNSYVVLRVIE